MANVAFVDLNIGVIGAGSWGTTVAHLAARNQPTTIWARRDEVAAEINEEHTNETYLPGFRLLRSLNASSDLEAVVSGADVIVMGVPSSGFRTTLERVGAAIRPWVPIVSLTKGLESDSNFRMTEIIRSVTPGHPYGVMTGPNLAKEIMAGYAAASVIAMSELAMAETLQGVFTSNLFRVYTNEDLIGCELGGCLKNVIAIAAGMADGTGAGDNTRAAVVTRGLVEISRLGAAMGGDPLTFSGLAGMGDLVATCFSKQSRNRFVGEQLGRGRKLQEIIDDMSEVAEGVRTSKVVLELAGRHDVEMPISEQVFHVCHEGRTAQDAYRGLLARELQREMHGLDHHE